MTRPTRDARVLAVAEKTLQFFSDTARIARSKLEETSPTPASAFASVNTLTSVQAVQNLSDINSGLRRELIQLLNEPAIARLVLRNEAGNQETLFIARAGALPGMASYRSEKGRLASLPVGGDGDVRMAGGIQNYQVIEKAELYPSFKNESWDSINTILRSLDYGTLTVSSLKELLRPALPAAGLDALDALFAEGRAAELVIEGVRRTAIIKMGLRDRPLLNQYQDETFRLPLSTRLVILGPPGTGKTTTLIKRLGQKRDSQYLDEEELAVVGRSVAGTKGLADSWLMFTPSALLKLYVKEAFAKEGIPASDEKIQTWTDYRRELARNRFSILRTPAGGGSFLLKDNLNSLQASALERQTKWFDDFDSWQAKAFWSEMAVQAKALAENADTVIAGLGNRLRRILDDAVTGPAEKLLAIGDLSAQTSELIARLKAETDGKIRSSFSRELVKEPDLLSGLANYVATLTEAVEDIEDAEIDDDDDARAPRPEREAAFETYTRAIRAHARARIGNRTLSGQSRNGKIIEWLGGKYMPAEDLRAAGQSLQVQGAARRFVNPLRRLIVGTAGRYRRFRRERQSEGIWYLPDSFAPSDIGPLEADVILLAMLRSARNLLANVRLAGDVFDGKYPILKVVQESFKTQIIVDEATDFSPIQLACMAGLSDPQARSFLACGDFNQRITSWGSRSMADLKWVLPDLVSRSVNITYRHSRQLNDLARRIARLSSTSGSDAELPADVNNEGVSPVLALGLDNHAAICAWLSERIGEIERVTGTLPSIAVLVNDEAEVVPLAEALDSALSDKSIRAVACRNGQVVGQENDVRVFDIQHVKGLEFEGVFFIGVDRLAKQLPELFDKYLYVGTTRAAFYLGITADGPALPDKIASLQDAFVERWA